MMMDKIERIDGREREGPLKTNDIARRESLKVEVASELQMEKIDG